MYRSGFHGSGHSSSCGHLERGRDADYVCGSTGRNAVAVHKDREGCEINVGAPTRKCWPFRGLAERKVKMQKSIEGIVSSLKEIIDQNGPTYPADEPYSIYTKLVESCAADRKTAAALLHFLANGLWDNAKCGDEELLSGIIRRECSLNKKMSDRLAVILVSLYSGENRREWKNKDHEGLKLFLKEEFVCTWKGFAVWDAGNGTVDCHYEAEIILKPTEKIIEDKELAQQLKKNTFMTKEAIRNLFSRRLRKYLDDDFEYYCTCEDYYQPVVEDYGSNLEYDLRKWCEENGFEFVSFEGDGDDGGYEPKFRNNWY